MSDAPGEMATAPCDFCHREAVALVYMDFYATVEGGGKAAPWDYRKKVLTENHALCIEHLKRYAGQVVLNHPDDHEEKLREIFAPRPAAPQRA